MPLDPQAKLMLDQLAALNLPDFSTLTPEEARKQFDATRLPLPPIEIGGVENRSVPGPEGEIPIRIYTPEGTGPFPVLVFFHGGGWVIGDLESHDALARKLALEAGCLVIAIDYRLAPESKYPAAAEDCYAATCWAAAHAAEIGGDPGRIAIGGDSAGGNLSAVVAQMARDRSGPDLCFELLVYPVTNHDYSTLSYAENAEGYFLTRSSMEWFWNHYLSEASEGQNAYASPLRADSLAGLPPALVITAEFDPLRDEGEAYAEKLRQAGVPVTCTRYDGQIHGFFSFFQLIDSSKEAVQEAAGCLRRAFGN